MATDYDASRKSEEEQKEESLEALRLAATDKDTNSGKIDEDETEAAESFELPGADLSNEELSVEVVPKQDDEFTCSACFLVHHRSARSRQSACLSRLRMIPSTAHAMEPRCPRVLSGGMGYGGPTRAGASVRGHESLDACDAASELDRDHHRLDAQARVRLRRTGREGRYLGRLVGNQNA